MAVTIVRTATSSQIGSLLTQASASNTYLTQVSASSTYLTQSAASANYLPQASASSTYLTQSSASSTYLTQSAASANYLPQASASSTYLTQSSASTTYAPKASPTFTGTVILPSGTVDSSMIANDTISDINIKSTAGISWTKLGISSTVSSTEIGYIDGASANVQTQINSKAPLASPVFTGTVTKPSQPYFHVRSTQATAVGGDVLWSVIDNNIGSYYTAANGRFTAPVAGTYFFSAHGLWNNADAGDMRIALYKNAAGINGNRFILTKTASNWMTFYLNDIIYLAAGDYVTVRYLQGTNTLHVDADYNGFRGWLLG
jgi:hypothetical protein